MSKKVPDMLRDAAKIYEERNRMYGDNYKKFGHALQPLMQNIKLKSPEDFNRFGILNQLFSKLTRYANMFDSGGHDDSLDDITVYAQMLKELDQAARMTNVEVALTEVLNEEVPKLSILGNKQ